MENWESPIAKSRPWNDFPLSCQRWTKEERDQRRKRRISKGTIATKFTEKKQTGPRIDLAGMKEGTAHELRNQTKKPSCRGETKIRAISKDEYPSERQNHSI